jgi:hypothetical protein
MKISSRCRDNVTYGMYVKTSLRYVATTLCMVL